MFSLTLLCIFNWSIFALLWFIFSLGFGTDLVDFSFKPFFFSFISFDTADRSTNEIGESSDGPVTISHSVSMGLFDRSEHQGFNQYIYVLFGV